MVASQPQIEATDAIIEELREIVGDDNVLSEPDELLVYECDGLPQHKHLPRAVVFPNSTEETSEVLALLHDEAISFAPRGAGTGLSGGALAINRGIVIELARMRKILEVDRENRIARVETGLVNAQLSRAVAPYGLYYVPDPSSQPSCTIGGNIAENAGGIHCLKYGTTTDHIVAARVVLADGGVVDLDLQKPGFDLLGVFVGSEGTFGIATEATVKLARIPPAVRTLLADFVDVYDASRAVSAIIAAGILPAALEMMDNAIIRAVEASVFTAGLPIDAQAVLLVELDGIEAGIDETAEKAEAILREHGARSVHRATDEKERKKLWAARKGAFGAVGRLSPDIMIQDAVVPRSRLPEVLAETYRISAKYNLQLANVFHAGDGNLHPLICFDLRRGADLEKVRQAGREIMETCVRAGGSITGEHGVGLDKSSYLPLIFSEDDMDTMLRVRAAFDPSGLCNPGKIIPMPKGCGEARAVATHSMSEPEAVATGPFHANRVYDPVAAAPGTDKPNPLPTREGAKSGAIPLAKRIIEAKLANEFKRIVGGGNVTRLSETSFAGTAQSNFSERALVIAPGSEGEACEVMRLAAQERLNLIPAGAGTFLDAGNAIHSADLILTSRRMTKVVRHEPADLIATAEAGVTLQEFQKHLAAAGQWLPIDPPGGGVVTLGAVVATGANGPHAVAYGPVRSFVIGMHVALADGRRIKAGGKVVKNVAGYDLCKLFTGSYGSLALITELTFKLRPLPAETRTIIATGPRESLLAASHRVTKEFHPVAAEIISSRLSKDLQIEIARDQCAVMVRFAGSSRAVITETAQALKLFREDSHHRCATYDEDAAVWVRLSEAASQTSDDLMWTATMLPSQLPSFLEDLVNVERDEASHLNGGWHAGIADGRLRMIARAPAYHRETVRSLEALRQKAENRGGSLIVERAPVEIKQEFDSWGSFGSAGDLMKRVKQQLDPGNALSPGRFEF